MRRTMTGYFGEEFLWKITPFLPPKVKKNTSDISQTSIKQYLSNTKLTNDKPVNVNDT